VSNGFYIYRCFEKMSKAEDSLMESSAELRKQLCEAEHMLCDWYSTM